LLSFIEFNQFQQYIKELIENDTKTNRGDPTLFNGVLNGYRHYVQESMNKLELTQFPSNVPVSEIIEQKQNENDEFLLGAKLKARELFNKYIKIGSKFEINISSYNREALYHILENKDNLMTININYADLLLLFEPSKDEMSVLLSYSLTRFRFSADFENVKLLFEQ